MSPINDMPEILVIDDEQTICRAFKRFFESRGWSVRTASSGGKGLEESARHRPDVIFLDVRLPDADGLDVLRRINESISDVAVVVITAYGTLEVAVRAVRSDAFDYLLKPIDLDRAAEVAARALQSRSESDRPSTVTGGEDESFIGVSPAMQEVFRKIGLIAHSDSAVLISGATGTGKELAARAIHHHSDRRDKPFIAVNCGALPHSLIESELFGYVRGAFTGAEADKPGRFELADGGTLFLDEVAEMSPAAQVKLLRVLDTQTVERLGSVNSINVNVRVIAATNRDLGEEINSGRFRRDLFYRLAVVRIEMPPLRSRSEDIIPLGEHFLALSAGDKRPQLSEQAKQAMMDYDWPGNVRELRNAMEHAAVIAGRGPVRAEHLPTNITSGAAKGVGNMEKMLDDYISAIADGGEMHKRATEALERRLIRYALEKCGDNRSRAAEMLGLHRNTLREKIKLLGENESSA